MIEMKEIKDSVESRLVKYFEDGCLCLITGRINNPVSDDLANRVDYFMKNCNCSRHPESAKRDCWDTKVNLSNIEIAQQYKSKGG